MNKPKLCINRTIKKVPMQKIFVYLTCINRTSVYSKHKNWSQADSRFVGFTVYLLFEKLGGRSENI